MKRELWVIECKASLGWQPLTEVYTTRAEARVAAGGWAGYRIRKYVPAESGTNQLKIPYVRITASEMDQG